MLELDPTTAIAERTIISDQIITQRAEIARLRAGISVAGAERIEIDPAVAWPEDVPRRVWERERDVLRADLSLLLATRPTCRPTGRLKEAERDGFATGVAAQKQLIAVVSEQVGIHSELTGDGVESRARLLGIAILRRVQLGLFSLQGPARQCKRGHSGD